MATPIRTDSKVAQLVSLLDEAMIHEEKSARCLAVKAVLEEVVRTGRCVLDAHDMTPTPDRYARRLLHRDPAGRYSVLAMVWGPGQGTPLHDHASMWCVECVYKGRIKVVSYSQGASPSPEVHAFAPEQTIYAGPGEAGALIPPFDYHTLENMESEPTVTLHVYGGEMTWCHAFIPSEGGYRRELRQLGYTE
ncbi:MAG: cysteine dioxygenase family protein [Fimbriimonas ginsengisoli]|uniref:Cysteine dioxygenase family protein n=1 Tax=Fimbriimonas ginsengisoli TaxID=1005039 RepID=A0A931LS75_FIMGI|nr:cysteine dioxygenase family protein [Fimbriimonas ginsengisoli]